MIEHLTPALAITGAVRRTSREKLFQEFGFEPFNKDVDAENFVVYLK